MGTGDRSHGRNGKLGGKERRTKAEVEEVVGLKLKLERDYRLIGRKQQTGGLSWRTEGGGRDGQKLRLGIRLEGRELAVHLSVPPFRSHTSQLLPSVSLFL